MRIIYVISLVLLSISVSASDSSEIVSLQKEVSRLKTEIQQIHQEDVNIKKLCLQQANDVDSLRNIHQQKLNNIDSLCEQQKVQADGLNTLADKVGADLTETNKKIDVSANVGACGIFIALIMLVVVYLVLRKKILRGSSSIDKIKAAQESLETAQKSLQEESVKFDSKLVELLDKQVTTQPQSSTEEQPDHTLALKVADEIVRIETNLSRMDETVKGYKQLKKAVERIRTNFLANGYEIVEMLGKPYNEGMKVVANFVSDDTLRDGEQKITGIIKPQINYKGKMIQSAQITVSQNL